LSARGLGRTQPLSLGRIVAVRLAPCISTAMSTSFVQIEEQSSFRVLSMRSEDGTNWLTRRRVLALTAEIERLAHEPLPLVITRNDRCFSAGAELGDIGAIDGPRAHEFSKMGQVLMLEIEGFPALVYATISGILHGRRTGSGCGLSSSRCLAHVRVWTSWRDAWADYRLGRHPTVTAVDWERSCPRNVCTCGQGERSTSLGSGIGRCACARSCRSGWTADYGTATGVIRW
jgi:hypothetical protein